MALPVAVSSCRVSGRFLSAVMDSTDPDQEPDGVPVPGLSVTFTATVQRVKVAGSTPPVVVELAPVTVACNDDGDLVDADGDLGVFLVASDDPDLEPTGWTWRATVSAPSFTDYSFAFVAPSGGDIDLTTVVPVPANMGTGLADWQAAVSASEAAAAEAQAAADSATAAATEADTAAADAAAAASSAAALADDAQVAADAAAAAVTDAESAAAAANTSASAAGTSATTAGTSASAAGTSATAASDSASTAAARAADALAEANRAATEAGKAATQAGAAATSASNAAASATAAAGSATAAATSATDAANAVASWNPLNQPVLNAGKLGVNAPAPTQLLEVVAAAAGQSPHALVRVNGTTPNIAASVDLEGTNGAGTLVRHQLVASADQLQLQVSTGGAVGQAFAVVRIGASEALRIGNFLMRFGGSTGQTIQFGGGSPEGVTASPPGSLYLRTSGGAGTTLYVKESGTGNTGWVAK